VINGRRRRAKGPTTVVFTILAIKECKWKMWELGFIY
jgi:hypothetical protein